jgi:hypothetical protein
MLQKMFCYRDVLLWRFFVCRGDVLCGYVLYVRLSTPLVQRRLICAAYTRKFIDNSSMQISQFCVLGIVHTCIG